MQQKERGWLWLRREQAPSVFCGLEKPHSDLDHTMQFLGAGEGLQGTGRNLKGVTAPIRVAHAFPGPGLAPHPMAPLRISLRRTAQRGKLGN